jgi:hypothetical protein
MLMSEDLPTFDRPMNAYSGLSGAGHPVTEGLLMIYFADFISRRAMIMCGIQ